MAGLAVKTYNKVPKVVKNRLAYLNATLGFKPRAKPDMVDVRNKFPKNYKAGVIITGDFELGWAIGHSKRNANLDQIARTERENMPGILEMLDLYEIPITWATVGHLMLYECSDKDHDWMSRIPYLNDHFVYESGDWYDVDPHSRWDDAPLWYAPDLISKIVNAKAGHEIGCHTFSHIDCRDEFCPPQVLDDELTACCRAAKSWGVKLSSMAFPAGKAGNFQVLRKHGIKIYRRRVYPFELAYPFRDNWGLLVTPTGYGLGISYPSLSLKANISRYKLAIDKALKTNTISHFWFHPSASPYVFEKILPAILEYCAFKRDRGELWVATMDLVQRHINNNQVL